MKLTNGQIKNAFEEFKHMCEASASLNVSQKSREFYATQAVGMFEVFKIFGLSEQLNEYVEGKGCGN